MAESIGNQLRDIYLAHSFDLEKVKTASAKNISKVLDDLIAEIVRELQFIDPLSPKRTLYRKERLNKLFNMADKTIKSRYKLIAGDLKRELATLAEIESIFVSKAVNEVLRVDMVDYVVSREVMMSLASDTLIEGAPSSEWWSAQSRTLQNEFKRAMRTGIAKGETMSQLAARIRGTEKPGVLGIKQPVKGVTDVPIEGVTKRSGLAKKAKRNAQALARTSYQQVVSEAREAVYQDNADVVKGVQHISTLDSRTTKICIAYAGATWNLAKEPINGNTLPYNGGVPRHWACRSIEIPILKDLDDILGVSGMPDLPPSTQSSFSKTGMSGQIADDVTFSDWMKSISTADQNKMLGRARADLWRSGKIKLSDMVSSKNGKVMSLSALKDKVAEGRFWSD